MHLAAAIDSRVGKRAAAEVLLAIDPRRLATARTTVFEAPNGVLLVRHVPASCIVDVAAGVTDRSVDRTTALDILGLDEGVSPSGPGPS